MWSTMNCGSMDPTVLVTQPDQHAFVVMGTNTIFLSHLTMFMMEEHEFQLVLRVTLPENVRQLFLADRAAHPDETYFLGNIEQDLMTVPELKGGFRGAFLGELYRGIPDKPHYSEWPWKHQTPIATNFRVALDQIVHYRHFDFNMPYPQTLTYALFGAGDEAHLVHFETKEPDFDQVLTLAEAPAWLPPQLLEAGITINVPQFPGDKVFCANPLTASTYKVQYQGQDPPREIKIGRNLWFCTKITNAKDPCAAPPH